VKLVSPVQGGLQLWQYHTVALCPDTDVEDSHDILVTSFGVSLIPRAR
jgi:hypothetical protein